MEDILARAKKVAEAAEVFTTSVEETSVQFETNRLKHVQGKQSTTMALRVIKNGRIGYALSSGEGKECRSGSDGTGNRPVRYARKIRISRLQLTYPEVAVFDDKVPQVTTGANDKDSVKSLSPR